MEARVHPRTPDQPLFDSATLRPCSAKGALYMYLYLFHLHSEGGFCFLQPRTHSTSPSGWRRDPSGARLLPLRTKAVTALTNARQLASLARTTLDTKSSVGYIRFPRRLTITLIRTKPTTAVANRAIAPVDTETFSSGRRSERMRMRMSDVTSSSPSYSRA